MYFSSQCADFKNLQSLFRIFNPSAKFLVFKVYISRSRTSVYIYISLLFFETFQNSYPFPLFLPVDSTLISRNHPGLSDSFLFLPFPTPIIPFLLFFFVLRCEFCLACSNLEKIQGVKDKEMLGIGTEALDIKF